MKGRANGKMWIRSFKIAMVSEIGDQWHPMELLCLNSFSVTRFKSLRILHISH